LLAQEKINQVFVGLGTNLGNRAANLKNAIDALTSHSQIILIEQSSIFENPAIEDAGPNDFLNQVVVFQTTLSAHEFFALMQQVEKDLDPDREGRGRKKARFIDLDILSFGDEKINDDVLTVPHPRMQERAFVMNPLNEVQTKIYKKRLFLPEGEDPAIKTLAEYSDFTRKLSDKEKEAISLIDEFAASKSDFVFRPMLLEDLDEILVIDEAAFGKKHWGRDTFVKELNNQYAYYLTVTNKAKKVLGFIGIWLVIDEMHIMTLAIDESARRQGLAEALMLLGFKHSFLNRIRTATLEVKANNIAAIKLYEKYKFKQQGMRPKYYADGQAALLFWTEEIYKDDFLDNFISVIARRNEVSTKQSPC
jgi:2-amino-4-hydroxy-6-hydroxymethyldihydropteridine diphosphokinase/ribosomal-protein-alanine acetyltransferase